MADQSGELLQGTLELLVLKALSLEPMHGWGLAQRLAPNGLISAGSPASSPL